MTDYILLNPVLISCCLWLCCFLKSTRMQWVTELGDAHHVPDPQDDGSRADMATQAAARGVPAVPRRGRHHHLLCVCRHLQTVSVYVKEESPLSYRRLHRARVDEQALTAPDPSGTYHGEQLSGPETRQARVTVKITTSVFSKLNTSGLTVLFKVNIYCFITAILQILMYLANTSPFIFLNLRIQ